jgi:hypothetical protein
MGPVPRSSSPDPSQHQQLELANTKGANFGSEAGNSIPEASRKVSLHHLACITLLYRLNLPAPSFSRPPMSLLLVQA